MTPETPEKNACANVLQAPKASGSIAAMPLRATLASMVLSLCASQGGAITTEYAMIVGFCGITVASAVVGLGPDLSNRYERTKRRLMMPIPLSASFPTDYPVRFVSLTPTATSHPRRIP